MWIIIFSVLLIFAILLFMYFTNKNIEKWKSGQSNHVEKMKEKFYDTTTDLKKIGGLLANNFNLDFFQKILSAGDVNYSDTSVCASINRKTCTAYSYLRRDLIPMLFMYPGTITNDPCGIILDPVKIWPLITLLAVVDADTNNRQCCTNEAPASTVFRNPFTNTNWDICMTNTLRAQGYTNWADGKYVVYMPLKDPNLGAGCSRYCNGDLNCMYNNSGGSINQFFMNSSPECIAGKYKDCFVFKQIDTSQVPDDIKNSFNNSQPEGYLELSFKKDCPDCKKPYLCVFDKSPNDKYEMIYEPDRIASYIGKDGLGFNDLFVKNNMDIGYLSVSQCRIEKKDWNLWIKILKDWYQTLLNLMNKDNSMSDTYSHMLANPIDQAYLENEVNLYINPDTTSDEYKKQNKIFQDAIIGFYYNANTCEEQLSLLNGIKSVTPSSPSLALYNQPTGNTNVFYNSVDRCDAFYGMTTDVRRKWETDNILNAKTLVRKVAKMFNDKHNRNVPVFKNVANNNSFPNYDSMKRALEGNIRFEEIFLPDDNDDVVLPVSSSKCDCCDNNKVCVMDNRIITIKIN